MTINKIAVPPELIEKISRNNCVAFIGAGLSMGAGLPSWSKLLRDMIGWLISKSVPITNKADLETMISDGKFLKVANMVIKRMQDQRFGEFLVSVFRKPRLKPTEAHLLLPEIPFYSVLTSNYDKLIESAYTVARGGESVPVSEVI